MLTSIFAFLSSPLAPYVLGGVGGLAGALFLYIRIRSNAKARAENKTLKDSLAQSHANAKAHAEEQKKIAEQQARLDEQEQAAAKAKAAKNQAAQNLKPNDGDALTADEAEQLKKLMRKGR